MDKARPQNSPRIMASAGPKDVSGPAGASLVPPPQPLDAAPRQASCVCGGLRAAVLGDPQRVAVCHCASCQRRTG